MTHRTAGRRPLARTFLLLLAACALVLSHAGIVRAAPPACGNGIVEDGEDCDSGSPLGSPDCNTLCRSIAFEAADPPYGGAIAGGTGDYRNPGIFSPGLACRPFDVRDGARNGPPVHVRYRIHLCQDAQGVDAFPPAEVRAVMADAAAAFAPAGILLEEEALVRFHEKDCDVPLGDSTWSDALVAATPPGEITISFVKAITNPVSQYGVGGFCNFFGPFCVNAGVYDTLVVHELGHFFGLAHTFECAFGVETAANCEDAGDLMCDTPPDRGPAGVYGIAECGAGNFLDGSCRGTCGNKNCTDGSKPDGYNWMGYYDCVPGHFSAEQQDFMRCSLDHEMAAYNADGVATTTTTTTLPEVLCGDSNGDGRLSSADALLILRAGLGLAACPVSRCDYDGNGTVSAPDALAVLRAAVGFAAGAKCPTAQ